MKGFVSVAVATLLALVVPPAQAGPVNPDISVLGDTRLSYIDRDGSSDTGLELVETEIAFVGPVNPYASAEAYLGIHGVDQVEIEEAKLIVERGLPGGLGLTVGRMLLDFGQLNTVHAHAYPFLDRPLVHQEMFGEDGALDVAARLDWIAPIDAVTLRATAGILRGDAFLGGHEHDAGGGANPDTTSAEADAAPEIGFSGRLELFAEPADDVSFRVGGSVLTGEHDPDESARALWTSVDGKVRWDLGPARSLVANAEAAFGSLDGTVEHAASDPWGWFGSLDFRMSRRWNVGSFVEGTSERFEDGVTTTRTGAFVGFALLEETTLFRLIARTTDPDEGESTNEVILQTLFGLGPHRPHRY
jgi:hypothetical protein